MIAAGLGTDVVMLGRLVSLRSAVGLAAPAFGSWADKIGYRLVMRIGLALYGLGMIWIGSSNNAAMAAPGMILAGLGTAGFVPTLQAYLSARLPYASRARGMGMVEYSWALTGIVGLSLIGLLISAVGWRVPFFVLGGGLLTMSAVLGNLPAATHRRAPTPFYGTPTAHTSFGRRAWQFFDLGSNARSAYATIVAGMCNYYAAMQIMITFGAWLNREYGLGPSRLGLVALLFGIFDLMASVSVSLFTDRIGKRRSVLIGTTGALTGYLLMPWLNVGIVPAVLGIALARASFEFSIVSTLPLLSEQVPSQRGKVMTLSAAATLGASTIATFVGPSLYTAYHVLGLASVSAVMAAIALLVLWQRVLEME